MSNENDHLKKFSDQEYLKQLSKFAKTPQGQKALHKAFVTLSQDATKEDVWKQRISSFLKIYGPSFLRVLVVSLLFSEANTFDDGLSDGIESSCIYQDSSEENQPSLSILSQLDSIINSIFEQDNSEFIDSFSSDDFDELSSDYIEIKNFNIIEACKSDLSFQNAHLANEFQIFGSDSLVNDVFGNS